MLEVSLSGTPEEMGEQHARQVRVVRPQIAFALRSFLETIDLTDADVIGRVDAASRYLEANAGRTWEMYRATVTGLDLDWLQMRAYALRSYLREPEEGCTVVADGRGSRQGTGPILAKTRDYHSEHMAIQVLVRGRPDVGYRYFFLGSAGSPGVFSSGMNETGLAAADTHVPSPDLGLGLPRYALMLDLLEKCTDVPSAVSYLRSVAHMGGGTITVCDREGRVAVCESSHRNPTVWESAEGWAVTTNHFTDPSLQGLWEGSEPEWASTIGRRVVAEHVVRNRESVTSDAARRLLGRHAGAASICRHGGEGDHSVTILGVVYEPASSTLSVATGNPCTADWAELSL